MFNVPETTALCIVLSSSPDHPPRVSITMLYCFTSQPRNRCPSSQRRGPYLRVSSSSFLFRLLTHGKLIKTLSHMIQNTCIHPIYYYYYYHYHYHYSYHYHLHRHLRKSLHIAQALIASVMSHWISMSQSNFTLSFSTEPSGRCSYHLWNFSQGFQWTNLATSSLRLIFMLR